MRIRVAENDRAGVGEIHRRRHGRAGCVERRAVASGVADGEKAICRACAAAGKLQRAAAEYEVARCIGRCADAAGGAAIHEARDVQDAAVERSRAGERMHAGQRQHSVAHDYIAGTLNARAAQATDDRGDATAAVFENSALHDGEFLVACGDLIDGGAASDFESACVDVEIISAIRLRKNTVAQDQRAEAGFQKSCRGGKRHRHIDIQNVRRPVHADVALCAAQVDCRATADDGRAAARLEQTMNTHVATGVNGKRRARLHREIAGTDNFQRAKSSPAAQRDASLTRDAGGHFLVECRGEGSTCARGCAGVRGVFHAAHKSCRIIDGEVAAVEIGVLAGDVEITRGTDADQGAESVAEDDFVVRAVDATASIILGNKVDDVPIFRGVAGYGGESQSYRLRRSACNLHRIVVGLAVLRSKRGQRLGRCSSRTRIV